MFKIDLHTHSIISHDGGIDEEGYKNLLERGVVNCVAITDHNEISFAQKLHKKLGNQIIVGEEIAAREGEIIGLFLKNRIEPGLSAQETVLAIRKQKGLVYIPHPYEFVREGISEGTLEALRNFVDIIEVFNSRTLQPATGNRAYAFAQKNKLATAASSDAHGYRAVGGTYSILSKVPSQIDLVSLLQKGEMRKDAAGLLARLTPKFNTINKFVSDEIKKML